MDLSETIEITRPDDNFESHPITFLDIGDENDEYTSSTNNIDMYAYYSPNKELEDAQEYLNQYKQYPTLLIREKCMSFCSKESSTSFLVKLFILKELEEVDTLLSLIDQSDFSQLNGTIVWENIVYCMDVHNKDCKNIIHSFLRYSLYPIEFRYYCLQSIKRNTFVPYYKEFITIIIHENKEFQFIIYMLECLRQMSECSYAYCYELYTSYSSTWGENEKADFADFLLTVEINECKELAESILTELGLTTNLYTSKQSVHNVDINTESIQHILNRVDCKQTEKETVDNIEEGCTTDQQRIAIKRIRYDNRLYHSQTLSSVLTKLYWFIQTLETKKECEIILYEELEDMGQRCSLGHYVRLLHVLSGFIPEGIIKIDPRKELKASFIHKLQKAIQESEQSELCMDAIYTQDEYQIIKYIYPLITVISEECIKEYSSLMDREQIEEEIRNHTTQYTLRDL